MPLCAKAIGGGLVPKANTTKVLPARKGPPDRTPEERQETLIGLAMDRAEEQLRDGTASSQVITHFLKLGTARELLEAEKLRHETALLRAKTEQVKAEKTTQELYAKAIEAMRRYSYKPGEDEEDDESY